MCVCACVCVCVFVPNTCCSMVSDYWICICVKEGGDVFDGTSTKIIVCLSRLNIFSTPIPLMLLPSHPLSKEIYFMSILVFFNKVRHFLLWLG